MNVLPSVEKQEKARHKINANVNQPPPPPPISSIPLSLPPLSPISPLNVVLLLHAWDFCSFAPSLNSHRQFVRGRKNTNANANSIRPARTHTNFNASPDADSRSPRFFIIRRQPTEQEYGETSQASSNLQRNQLFCKREKNIFQRYNMINAEEL